MDHEKLVDKKRNWSDIKIFYYQKALSVKKKIKELFKNMIDMRLSIITPPQRVEYDLCTVKGHHTEGECVIWCLAA